ncbi:MAG: hypothetical protein ACFFDT_12640 [Candidatus Hodarchaeota archaeon]
MTVNAMRYISNEMEKHWEFYQNPKFVDKLVPYEPVREKMESMKRGLKYNWWVILIIGILGILYSVFGIISRSKSLHNLDWLIWGNNILVLIVQLFFFAHSSNIALLALEHLWIARPPLSYE